MTQTANHTPNDSAPSQGGAGCLVRLVWMIFGNLVAAGALISILGKSGVRLSLADAVLWSVVALMVLLRWLDVTRLGGQTASGGPATVATWRRYATFLIGGALAAWLLAYGWVWMK